jgi:diguanylate cyclase (GGDEF)-like protein
MVLDLVNNVALLLAVCWIQSLVSTCWVKGSLTAQILSGMVFGTATVVVMMTSILIEPGLWLWTDSGMVVVSVSTLLYGPISGGIALLVGMAYKLWIGGIASTGAVISLLISFGAGLLLRLIARRFNWSIGGIHLLVFGLVVHAVGNWQLYHFYIPVEIKNAPEFYGTLLSIMSVATAFLGLQLRYIERKTSLEKEVRAHEKRLSLITQSIPDQLILADKNGTLTDVFTPQSVVDRLSRGGTRSLADLDAEAYEKHYAFLISRALGSHEAVVDTYSSHSSYLLDDKQADSEHHFESVSKRVEGDSDDEVIILTRDITRRVKAEQEVLYLAHYDPLTTLPNAYKAISILEDYVTKYGELNKKFHVVMLHLDNFYLFNKSLGKEAGDTLLKHISGRIREYLGEDYFIARFSGVEFLIISDGAGDPSDLVEMFRKLRLEVSIPVEGEEIELKLVVSAGVSRFPVDGDDQKELVRKASLAMESAVASTNKVRFYHPMLDRELNDLLTLRGRLLNAVKEAKLDLYYQPVFSLKDNSISAVQAVIRCDDDKYNLKEPGIFLEAAERSGLMLSLSSWTLERACFAVGDLKQNTGFSGELIVKVSHFELVDPEFPFIVQSVLSRTQFEPGKLCIEIAESGSDKSMRGILAAIRELDSMGVGLKIDFYSSSCGAFMSFNNTRSTKLRLSCEFVLDTIKNDRSGDTLAAIVTFARSLNIETLVDGIDDPSGSEAIKDLGFDNAQGDYYASPLPFAKMKELLLSQ